MLLRLAFVHCRCRKGELETATARADDQPEFFFDLAGGGGKTGIA